MPKSGCDTPLRGSSQGSEQTVWKFQVQWASGVPSLVKKNSDVDMNIGVAAAVTDGGSGATLNLKFPKSKQARLLTWNLSPATPGTASNYRYVQLDTIVPSSGTAKARMLTPAGAITAPADGSILDLFLLLD